MKEIVKSDTTGREYYPSEVVRIINSKQCAAYLANGATLLDIYPSRDFNTGDSILVYIFSRKETRELYDKWCLRQLN